MANKVQCPQCGEECYATDQNCMACGTALEGGSQSGPIGGPQPAAASVAAAPSPVPPEMQQFITQRRGQGVDEARIASELQGAGWDPAQVRAALPPAGPQVGPGAPGAGPGVAASAAAKATTSAAYRKVTEVTGAKLVAGIAGGLAGAVVSGLIWAAIVATTGYELGFIAWGIGLACGFSVALACQARGLAYQLTAMACSLVGFFIGKMGAAYYIVQQAVAEDPSIGEVGLLAYLIVLPFTLGFWDIVWVCLALAAAWKMLSVDGSSE